MLQEIFEFILIPYIDKDHKLISQARMGIGKVVIGVKLGELKFMISLWKMPAKFYQATCITQIRTIKNKRNCLCLKLQLLLLTAK